MNDRRPGRLGGGGARTRRRAAVLALVAGAVTTVLALGGPDDPRGEDGAPLVVPALAAPPAAAFDPGRPAPRPSGRHESRWAPVLRPVAARARPNGRVVARLAARTPEGTANVVTALDRTEDSTGRLWVRARLPAGRTGWIPRAALGGYTTVTTRLIVDRARLTVTLLRDGRRAFDAAAAIGTAAAPTPGGEFYVRNRLTRYRSPFYGPVAFGTSARSKTLTDWPGGGFVGIHGTNRPELIPGRVSHGCIRLRNRDIRRLARLMPVGTPVTIR